MEFGTFDIETIGLGGEFINSGTYFNGSYSYFEDIGSMLNYMINSECMVWYGHNTGRYDTRYFFNYLIENKYLLKPLVINGSIAKLSVYRKKKRVLEIRDSYLLLSSSLKRLTFDFDVKHKKIELEQDYNNIKIDEQEKEYLKYDVIGLYEVLEEFFKLLKERNIEPKLTYSSCALADFKTNYKEKFDKIRNIENDELRSGYYGGRTEVFKTYYKNDDIPLNCYDVNSLYPYVMSNFKFPVGEYTISREPITEEYISKIEFYCPKDLNIPLLPVHYNKKLIFPTGYGTGVYTRHEIEKAKQLGYKIKYIKTYNFKDSDYLFKDYVDYWYNIKKNSKGSKRNLSKLMLNSLYGKFGTRADRERYIINPNKEWIRKNYNDWNLNDFEKFEVWSNKFKFVAPYVNLPIILYITSLSRLRLYEYIEKCEGDIYYCDTDSVFTTKNIDVSDKLGDVKLEKQSKEAHFLRPKVYGLVLTDESVLMKAKGLNKSMLKLENYREATQHNDYSKFTQTTTNIGGFKTTLKRFGKFISNYKMTKTLHSEYTKRIILEDGVNTKPLYFEKEKDI